MFDVTSIFANSNWTAQQQKTEIFVDYWKIVDNVLWFITKIVVFLCFFDWHCFFVVVKFNCVFVLNDRLWFWVFNKRIDIAWTSIDIAIHRCVISMLKWLHLFDWAFSTRSNIKTRRIMIESQFANFSLVVCFIYNETFNNVVEFNSITLHIYMLYISSIDILSNVRNVVVNQLSTKRAIDSFWFNWKFKFDAFKNRFHSTFKRTSIFRLDNQRL